jgi:ABC-type glutathione transport system ATPase component
MTVLSIRDLNVTFTTEAGPLHALKDVSFDVPERRIVGIVGESGCGKSTLINAILGLLADNGGVSRAVRSCSKATPTSWAWPPTGCAPCAACASPPCSRTRWAL